MEKHYFKNTPKGGHQFNPKQETIDFLLQYSKALNVTAYKDIKFESFLN